MIGVNAVEESPRAVLLFACCPPADHEAMRDMLEPDYCTEYAPDVDAALEIACNEPVAAIFCDFSAPECPELLENLRSTESLARLPILALESTGSEEAQCAALDQGAEDVIAKTTSPRLARARIQNALRRASSCTPAGDAPSAVLADQRRAEAQVQEKNEQLRFLNETSRYLLVGTTDSGDAIHQTLEKTREYFDGDRAYIFELDDAHQESNNTYESCAQGVPSVKDGLQHVPYSLQEYALNVLGAGGTISLDNAHRIAASGLNESNIITDQGIHGIILVPLLTGTKLIGFMGVDNPARNITHVNHLASLGDYITAILQRRDSEAQILHDNRVLQDIMNDMPGGFVQQRVSPDGRTVPIFINEEFCRMSGMSHGECVEFYSTDGFTGVHPDDNAMAKAALERLITTRETITLRLRLIRGDGSYVPMQAFYRVTDDRDDNLLLSGYYTDLTEQLATEEREMAEHDELTGLFNRTKLARMKASEYQVLSSCGVLFFDVNHLKTVNDTQGHDRGDTLLRIVADSILSIADDRIHGYRYGGDEFLVVACNGEEDELPKLIERWKGHMDALAEDRKITATAAVGCCWSEAPFTLNDLVHRADQAMYTEKHRTRQTAE